MFEQVHIIGGGGGIGRWILDKIFISDINVCCYDKNEKTLQNLPSTVSACIIETDKCYEKYAQNFQRNDLILLTVPPNALKTTVEKLASYAKDGTLFVSLASVQEHSIKILKSHVPKNSSYLGCHPLFGPTVASPVGQLVALTEYNEKQPQHRNFRERLSNTGLIVTNLNPAEHDQYMSVVQALTHFCLIGFAATLPNTGVRPSDVMKLRTPNFQFLYAFASRVIKLSSTTTGSIQSTGEASKVRLRFIETLSELHKQFETANTVSECAKTIEEIRSPLAGAEVDEGAEIAAVAVDSLQRFEELLHKYRSTGCPFSFHHRLTNRIHIVKIIDIQQDDVIYDESIKFVNCNGEKRLAMGLNANAKENYRKFGISVPELHRAAIKKRNIKLFTSEEMKDFYKKNMLPISIVHNFLNPFLHKEDYFEEWLPLLVKGIWQCVFMDSYRRRNETERVTIKIHFNPNYKRTDLVENIRRTIEEGQLTSGGSRQDAAT